MEIYGGKLHYGGIIHGKIMPRDLIYYVAEVVNYVIQTRFAQFRYLLFHNFSK